MSSSRGSKGPVCNIINYILEEVENNTVFLTV